MPKKDKSPLPTEETLRELYVDQGLTMATIAARFGKTTQCIQRRLASLGVKGKVRRREFDSDSLRVMFIDQGLTKAQIGAKLRVSPKTIGRALRRNNIARERAIESYIRRHSREEVMRLYVVEGLLQADAAATLGIPTRAFQLLLNHYEIKERHKRGPRIQEVPEAYIRRLYVERRLSVSDIARESGYSEGKIRDRLKELGIFEFRRGRLPNYKTIIDRQGEKV